MAERPDGPDLIRWFVAYASEHGWAPNRAAREVEAAIRERMIQSTVLRWFEAVEAGRQPEGKEKSYDRLARYWEVVNGTRTRARELIDAVEESKEWHSFGGEPLLEDKLNAVYNRAYREHCPLSVIHELDAWRDDLLRARERSHNSRRTRAT